MVHRGNQKALSFISLVVLNIAFGTLCHTHWKFFFSASLMRSMLRMSAMMLSQAQANDVHMAS